MKSKSKSGDSLERGLNKLLKGEKGVVQSVSSSDKTLCSKLLSMGIVAGTLIEVLAIAPLGDPIEVKAKGYKLSLRIKEAEGVRVIPA